MLRRIIGKFRKQPSTDPDFTAREQLVDKLCIRLANGLLLQNPDAKNFLVEHLFDLNGTDVKSWCQFSMYVQDAEGTIYGISLPELAIISSKTDDRLAATKTR